MEKDDLDLSIAEKKAIMEDNKIIILPFFKKPKEEEAANIDHLCAFYIEQLIFLLNNYGFDVLSEQFQADINLVALFLKTTLYRSKNHNDDLGIDIDDLHSMLRDSMELEKIKLVKTSKTKSANKALIKKKFKELLDKNTDEKGTLNKENLLKELESV